MGNAYRGAARGSRRHALAALVGLAMIATTLAAVDEHAAPAAAAPVNPYPAVWVGSPVGGDGVDGRVRARWGTPPYTDTVPPLHHKLGKVVPTNHWAVDLSRVPTTTLESAVRVFAAPSNSAYDKRVTAWVTQVIPNNVCWNGGGGSGVTVGFYLDRTSPGTGILLGSATYAHLRVDPTVVKVGAYVNRWGGILGPVAALSGAETGGSNCWTGPHVHFEARSASGGKACWNREYKLGSAVSRSNFVGFISGPALKSTMQPCP
jgi:hypothetical protein